MRRPLLLGFVLSLSLASLVLLETIPGENLIDYETVRTNNKQNAPLNKFPISAATPPTLLTISTERIYNGSVFLNWTDVSEAWGYYIYRDNETITDYKAATRLTYILKADSTNSYTDKLLESDVFYYVIVAVIPFADDLMSNCESADVYVPIEEDPWLKPPERPHTEDGKVNLTWSPCEGNLGYEVWRDGVKIASATSTNYIDQLSQTGSYCYVVKAINGTYERSSIRQFAYYGPFDWENPFLFDTIPLGVHEGHKDSGYAWVNITWDPVVILDPVHDWGKSFFIKINTSFWMDTVQLPNYYVDNIYYTYKGVAIEGNSFFLLLSGGCQGTTQIPPTSPFPSTVYGIRNSSHTINPQEEIKPGDEVEIDWDLSISFLVCYNQFNVVSKSCPKGIQGDDDCQDIVSGGKYVRTVHLKIIFLEEDVPGVPLWGILGFSILSLAWLEKKYCYRQN